MRSPPTEAKYKGSRNGRWIKFINTKKANVRICPEVIVIFSKDKLSYDIEKGQSWPRPKKSSLGKADGFRTQVKNSLERMSQNAPKSMRSIYSRKISQKWFPKKKFMLLEGTVEVEGNGGKIHYEFEKSLWQYSTGHNAITTGECRKNSNCMGCLSSEREDFKFTSRRHTPAPPPPTDRRTDIFNKTPLDNAKSSDLTEIFLPCNLSVLNGKPKWPWSKNFHGN